MRKLVVLFVLFLSILSCKKEINSNVQQQLPKDTVLENVEIDIRSRKPPKDPHGNPHDPQPPVPPTVRKGCLLIDFNGHDVTGLWGSFYCEPAALNIFQQLSIENRVRYDYSFNDSIVVTTDEAVYNTYPQNKRRRCVVTTTNFYGNVGGVAYINSFSWYDESPCFVFSSLLLNNEKYISDATSHEFGHTFGCRHAIKDTYFPDGTCVKDSEYLIGDFIMGNSYNSCCPIFGIAETACDVKEDEKQIINNTINQ